MSLHLLFTQSIPQTAILSRIHLILGNCFLYADKLKPFVLNYDGRVMLMPRFASRVARACQPDTYNLRVGQNCAAFPLNPVKLHTLFSFSGLL